MSNFSGRGGPVARFAEVKKAKNIGKTLARIVQYFAQEKTMVLGMLAVVVMGTVFGMIAAALQSKAIDIIAGEETGGLIATLIFMLAVYVAYSAGQLLQGLINGHLSQRIVKKNAQRAV